MAMYGRVREHTTDNLSNGYHYKHNVIAAVPAGGEAVWVPSDLCVVPASTAWNKSTRGTEPELTSISKR